MTVRDPSVYRPCAGLMIVNRHTQVFVGKRIDIREGDWWQMPQGGIDPGEDAREGALRELYEETGIRRDLVDIEATSAQEHYYDLPPELNGKLWGGAYVGQRQRWYLMRFSGDDADVDIAAHDPREFTDYRWVEPGRLPELIIPFKRPVYEAVLAEFDSLLR